MAAGWTIVRHKASTGLSAQLLAAAVPLAQTAMGAAVHSDAAAAGVVLEASPAAIRPEVFPAVTPLEAFPVVVSRVAMVVGVAEAVDESQLINPKEDQGILFFLKNGDASHFLLNPNL